MFAVGVIVIGISLARFPSIKEFTTGKNVTLDFVPIALFSSLENGVGVTCACLPSLRGLFARLLSRSANTGQGPKPPPIPDDLDSKSKVSTKRWKGGMTYHRYRYHISRLSEADHMDTTCTHVCSTFLPEAPLTHILCHKK
ncbi:hypothetical protein F4825DRAFT_334918 [Nemania diffusa]|nr:hypothetical protein F4825DRAFT_334918 [Nemania diffusa]